MNHQPFEVWMFADQALTFEQKRQLQAHLRICSQCAALAEVSLALHSAKVVAPASGFADRFQVRLAAQRKTQRQRNFWGFLILVLSGLGVLLWLTWPVLGMVVNSPAKILSAWLSFLLAFWFSIQALAEAGTVLWRVMPALIPPHIWALITFVFTGWSLLWVLSIWKFARIPQGV